MASDVNNVVLIGRLVADCGVRQNSFVYTQNGTCRATVSIAVNRSRKQGEQWVDDVSYFDITIWGKTAESLKPYLLKGKQIAVKGFLKQDKWTDQQGQNHSRVSIIAETIQLIGGNGQQNGQQQQGNYQQQPQRQQQNGQQNGNVPYAENQGGFQEDIPYSIDDMDIPF